MPHKPQQPHEIHSDLLEQAQQVHQHLVDNLHENDTMVSGGNYGETSNTGAGNLGAGKRTY